MTERCSPGKIQFATPAQLALLRAGLLEGPAAVEAANRWLALLGSDGTEPGLHQLDLACRRLLPLVYRNVKHSLPPRFQIQVKSVHHEYWAENQKRLGRLEELLPWFEADGIPTLLLKGMALSILHYRDMALRPMSDLDILVPEERAPEIVRRLLTEGWTFDSFLPSALTNRYFYRHTHAISFTHPDFGALDLHWHVLAEATFRGADQPFWSGSVPLTAKTIQTRALNPTDQLLHACVHGFRANDLPPIRWVADALTILRTNPINWTRLLGLAKQLHVTIPLGASLSFLREAFPEPIPQNVVEDLQAAPIDQAERRYFETLAYHSPDWRDVLAYNIERHRRANRDRNPIFGMPTLPRQLQLHYNLPQLKDLGTFAFARLGRRILKGLGRS